MACPVRALLALSRATHTIAGREGMRKDGVARPSVSFVTTREIGRTDSRRVGSDLDRCAELRDSAGFGGYGSK